MRQVSSHAVEIMGGQDDRDAVFVQVAEQVQDVVAGGDVNAARGLIEQQQLRIAQECTGKEHALLLPTGELADVTFRKIGNTEAIKHAHHSSSLRATGPRQATSACARHQDALEHRDREVPVDSLKLRNVGDPQTRFSGDRSLAGLERAQEQAQQGGLAGPRGADNPGELILVYVEVDVAQHDLLVVTRRYVIEAEQDLADSGSGHCG